MLHLAVAPLPRDFGGVEDCLFRCSPIDNLITLCQVKSNCPKQWKSRESHLCQHGGSVQDTLRVEIFSPASSSCLPLPERSISSRLNEIWDILLNHSFWITLWYIFFFYPPPPHTFQSLHRSQSSQWNKCGKSETGSPLKYYSCIIS